MPMMIACADAARYISVKLPRRAVCYALNRHHSISPTLYTRHGAAARAKARINFTQYFHERFEEISFGNEAPAAQQA